MSEITVVVVARARPEQGDAGEAAFRELTIPTHAEEGCLLFALHRVTSDRDRIVLLERWASRADLDAHLASPHLVAFREASADIWAEPMDIMLVDPLGAGDPAKGSLAGA